MNRTIRLFGIALLMLVAAVLICWLAQDDPAGRARYGIEIKGKLSGLEALSEAPLEKAPVSTRGHAPSGLSSAGVGAPEMAQREGLKGDSLQEPVTMSSLVSFRKEEQSEQDGSREKRVKTSGETAGRLENEPSGTGVKAGAPSWAPAAERKVQESKTVPVESEKTASWRPATVLPTKQTERKSEASSKPEKKASPPERSSSSAGVKSAKKSVSSTKASRSAVEEALKELSPSVHYDRVVTSTRFAMQGSLIKLVILGNSPMVGHYSILKDPDRVVLDLAGMWKITPPRVPSNRLIRAVRVGLHEDKTRLVFDMKTTGKVTLVPLDRNALELRIQ